jgi:steroid delta-isomerase-like uncharacterized protein
MSMHNAEKQLQEWARAWSTPDAVERLVSLFTDDCVYEDVPLGAISRGKAELQGFYHMIYSVFPDFKIELTSQFVTDSRAGAEWVLSGTQKGDLPGLPATNKAVSVRGASAFELQGNRLKRCSDYFDLATALRQVGVLPSSENG